MAERNKYWVEYEYRDSDGDLRRPPQQQIYINGDTESAMMAQIKKDYPQRTDIVIKKMVKC